MEMVEAATKEIWIVVVGCVAMMQKQATAGILNIGTVPVSKFHVIQRNARIVELKAAAAKAVAAANFRNTLLPRRFVADGIGHLGMAPIRLVTIRIAQ